MNIRNSIVLCLCVAVVAPGALAGGGTVVQTTGNVFIVRDKVEYPAAEASSVQRGDTIKVGKLGNVTIQFEDDSMFTIPGPASFKVDEFTMPSKDAGGKAQYTLRDGGLRTVTGRISEGAKDEYSLRTDEATLSVAGTSYASIRCALACGKHPAGTYVRTDSGVVIITNVAGRLKLRKGNVAYVASSTKVPVLTKFSPFDDPLFAAAFSVETQIEGETKLPPRIEQEPPASPS